METHRRVSEAEVAAGADGGLTAGYDLGEFFDEMFEAPGRARPHYRLLAERLAAMTDAQLEERVKVANAFFLTQGIGFTVYGDEAGTNRIFPFDLVPRIVPADEWEVIERGLVQRLRSTLTTRLARVSSSPCSSRAAPSRARRRRPRLRRRAADARRLQGRRRGDPRGLRAHSRAVEGLRRRLWPCARPSAPSRNLRARST